MLLIAAAVLAVQIPVITPREAFPHAAPVERVVVDSAGKLLFTLAQTGADDKREFRCFELKREKLRWTTKCGRMDVTDIRAGKETLYFGYKQMAAANFIEIESGKDQYSQGGPDSTATSTSLVCSPDDKWVWIGTNSGLIRLVKGEINNWKRRNSFNQGVTSLALAPNGKSLAIGGRDGTIRFGHAKNASIEERPSEGHTSPVTKLIFGQKGKLLISGSEDGTVRTWTSSGKPRLEFTADQLGESKVVSLACDPKGKWLAVGLADQTIRIFDPKKGDELLVLKHDSLQTQAGMAVIEKGAVLVTGGTESLLLWDIKEWDL